MSSRGFPITQQRRAERRKQAEARQEEYDRLSLQQKLDRLPINGAKRQRSRLMVALAKQNMATQPKSPSPNKGLAWDSPGKQAPAPYNEAGSLNNNQ